MNKDTRTIAQLLGVSEQTALKIQDKMGENGLDFSECDQREFNRSARAAYRQILQPGEY
jgi:transposase